MRSKTIPVLILCVFAVVLAGAAVVKNKEPQMESAVLNVKDFGAVGDGKADDTQAIQAAINKGIQAGTGVYIPRGTYMTSKTIEIPLRSYALTRALRISSDWATIMAAKEMDSCMHVNAGAWLTIERVVLNGNNLAKHGFAAFKISGKAALVQQLAVMGATSHGIVLEKCQGSTYRSCTSRHNGGDGWRLIDCNAAHFDSCVGFANAGNGFTIVAKDFSAGCMLTSFWSEKNKGHGVDVGPKVISPVLLRDAWIEGNGLDGVRIGGVDAVLNGLGVTGRGKDGHRAIRLLKSAAACHVTGCFVQYGGGEKAYQNIRVESDPKEHYIAGNFHRQERQRSRIEPEIVWKD